MIKKSSVVILVLAITGLFIYNQAAAQTKKETTKTKKTECSAEKSCCKDKSGTKTNSCEKECNADSKTCKEKADTVNTSASKISNKTCPVMGEKVNPKIETVTYKDQTIGFCCKKCVEKFKKDPEKYLNKLKTESKADKS